jgi:UDP-4-amino-4,6-dideoxy-N-acetyl-beta-L-altrosamine transaminase
MGVVKPLLPYGRQWIEDDDIEAVVAQLKSDWLTQGPAVAEFEKQLCQATGAKYAVAVSSGTAALHLASLAAGVGEGDVGVTSDITFVASANGIRYAGGKPVLVDVDPATALISLDELEARTKGLKPKVLIPVDFSGAVADLPRVRALADKLGAMVVEDAAHSLGATYTHEGQTFRAGCCAHAQMAILSFHPVKHVTTGEGGAITTNDPKLYATLNELRTHGITKDPARLGKNDGPWYYEQVELGLNYRLTDLQCALGISQMKKLGRFVARRRELAKRYDAAFAKLADRVTPLKVRPGTESSYHLYVLNLVPKKGEALSSVADRRRALYMALREENILPQVHYIPVHTQPDFIRARMAEGKFPGAEQYYAGCISLPLFPRMSDADCDRVIDAVSRAVAA